MIYRRIAALPFAFVALGMGAVALTPPEGRATMTLAVSELAKLTALVGCAAAAVAFDRGDYLRRGWFLNAACFAMLLVRDAVLTFVPGSVDSALTSVVLLLANVCGLSGAWTMARAMHVAGVELPGGARARHLTVAAAVLLALALTAPTLLDDVQQLLRGRVRAVGYFASDFTDLLSLPLIAPVTLTAIAMRGGLLRWTWGLFAASLLSWLLFDAITMLPRLPNVGDVVAIKLVGESIRLLACTFACAAGLAQRRAVRDE